MEKDSAPGPDRDGVRWLLLIAKNELREGPDHSGLQLLCHLVMTTSCNNITTGEFSELVSLVLFVETFIPLEKDA